MGGVNAIELLGLTKKFGSLTAVEDLNLSVKPGEVMGFLGPNGAGKTTAMRILIGLLAPTSGTAKILGYDVRDRSKEMLARVGYLPGVLELYEHLTGKEFLHFVSRIRGKNCDKQIKSLSNRLDIDLKVHIHDLSRGNRQKIGVVAAFMHNPEVLILDEPTSGLDPLVQREFEGILDEATAQGAAVLLSSHFLSEVELLSNRIAIIHKGKLLLVDEMDNLRNKALRRVEFSFDKQIDSSAFKALPSVTKVVEIDHRVLLEVMGSETELLRLAANLGASSVRTEETNLDEIFVGLIDNGGAK